MAEAAVFGGLGEHGGQDPTSLRYEGQAWSPGISRVSTTSNLRICPFRRARLLTGRKMHENDGASSGPSGDGPSGLQTTSSYFAECRTPGSLLRHEMSDFCAAKERIPEYKKKKKGNLFRYRQRVQGRSLLPVIRILAQPSCDRKQTARHPNPGGARFG